MWNGFRLAVHTSSTRWSSLHSLANWYRLQIQPALTQRVLVSQRCFFCSTHGVMQTLCWTLSIAACLMNMRRMTCCVTSTSHRCHGHPKKNNKFIRVISGFFRGWKEFFRLLSRYAAQGDLILTFRNYLSGPIFKSRYQTTWRCVRTLKTDEI